MGPACHENVNIVERADGRRCVSEMVMASNPYYSSLPLSRGVGLAGPSQPFDPGFISFLSSLLVSIFHIGCVRWIGGAALVLARGPVLLSLLLDILCL